MHKDVLKYDGRGDEPPYSGCDGCACRDEEIDQLREQATKDARRYRRLRVLGCAVMNTPQLNSGTVSRFTNLDSIVDADIDDLPSRGEA